MNCARIQTGEVEPIVVLVEDATGDRLTGKTDIKIKVRRLSDDRFFDWDDDTFKPPGSVTQLLETLDEVDSTYSPGVYQLDTASHVNGFDTSAITNAVTDDTYYVTAVQDGGTDAILPPPGEIKVGQYVDDIPDFTVNERTEIRTVLGVTGTGTPNEAPTSGVLSIILGLVQSNFFLDQTVYNGAGLLTGGRIRIFPTKAATDSATDGGTGEGELAVFNVTAVAEPVPADSLPATYKVTRES